MARPTVTVLAAAVEVLRREIEGLRKKCRGCPHSKRPVGFQVDVKGERVEQDEEDSCG